MSALPASAAGAALPASATRTRPTIWIVYGVMGVLLAAYFARELSGANHYSSLVDGWMVAGFELVASGLCLGRGLVRRPGRAVALVLGVALLCWSAGDVAITIEALGGATPSAPSPADAFYLAFFPLAYVAVVLLMRGGTRRLSTPSWLDGAVAGLGAAAICAAFAFPSLRRLAGGGSLSVATNLAYPIGDLLLLFLVVGGTAMLSGRRRGPWLLLATGVAVNVVGDTSNLLSSSLGTTHFGVLANAAAWPTSVLLMSMAVWLGAGHASPFAAQKQTGFVLPALAAASGLAILVVGTLHHTSDVAIGLATATLVVVGIRLAWSARGMRTLTTTRYRQSVTDDLTGLGNRRYLYQVLDAFFADQAGAAMPERRLAFLFIDLNRFKELNDAFGHPAGDAILKQLGTRLKASLRGSDELIRFGGDEFAVVLMDADAEYATTIAGHLTDSLREPFALEAVSSRLSASIGIAHAPSDATDSAALMARADVAMYRAKSSGLPFVVFEHERDFEGDGNRLRLAEELRLALERGALELHYQPQLDLRSDEIPGVEALVRWPHPRLGLLHPLSFLPVAEEAGLMGPLTNWVLEAALAQCAAWRSAGQRITVSVNISASNLLDAGFIELVRGLLERCELPADALILEITETSLITEFERSRGVIAQLRDLGLVVSIDDFGAGFTSLAFLGSLAVGELKLDRTFITRLASGEREREVQLVRATIDLGHALGLRVVAEGVEDYATLALLARSGCDLVQGYFIDVPRPAGELTFLTQPNASRPAKAARAHHDAPLPARTSSTPAVAARLAGGRVPLAPKPLPQATAVAEPDVVALA
jgi:diguanylate cyclase (GGDEF)-like protein